MNTQDQHIEKRALNEKREDVRQLLDSQVYCTFVTIDKTGAPDGAVVSFSETAQGDFLIGTNSYSHKARHVQADTNVAMVVYDASSFRTALIKGEAEVLSAEHARQYEERHYRKTPDSLPFKGKPGEVLIRIKPYFIKYSDVNSSPWHIIEYGSSRIAE